MKLLFLSLSLCAIENAFGLLSPLQSTKLTSSNLQLVNPSTSRLQAEGESNALEGKTIYQRTFYKLTPGSQVSIPNALVLEERLRFQMDPNNPGYAQPIGKRSYIFREGTAENKITGPLYRFDVGSDEKPHNGPGTMDASIATALWMASNPHLIQGDMLQLGCGSGAASVLGCIGAKLVLGEELSAESNWSAELLTVPEHKSCFPKKLHHLTLSDETEEDLKQALVTAKHLDSKHVTLRDIRWSLRPPGRRFDRAYRTIISSDLDFEYPSAKELARTAANYLLPSNEVALASTKEGVSGGSFGALGMDMADSSSTSTEKSLDSRIPPTFVHVGPETNDNLRFLKNFLEKGFKMSVDYGFVNLERLSYTFQTLDHGADEAELEKLETPKLMGDSKKGFEFVQAVHHPDYSGQGTGEYFFPLETGAYEGGSRSTWLEPEADPY